MGWDQKIIKHLNFVKAATNELPAQSALCLAVSCWERQFELYKKASACKSWSFEGPDEFRKTLDWLWNELERGKIDEFPLENIKHMIPPEDSVADFDFALANYIAGCFKDFLSGLTDQNIQELCGFASVRTLDVLDMFYYELPPEPEWDALRLEIVGLLDREIERHESDIKTLEQVPDKPTIASILAASKGVDLFDERWPSTNL